jgi:hypothetical protein
MQLYLVDVVSVQRIKIDGNPPFFRIAVVAGFWPRPGRRKTGETGSGERVGGYHFFF